MTATVASGEEHIATIPNGTYRPNIGITTIQSFCNDPNGYTIYAIGYTGGDAGISAGTNTVLHNDTVGSTYDIPTGTATTAGSADISNWAMKLSAVTTASSGTTQPYAPNILSDTNGSYANYHIVPSSYTKVASFNNMTDNKGGIGSSLTTTYAAYISGTQPAGTYEGQVKYVLVHPSSHLNPDILYMQEVDQWADTLTEINQEVTAYDTRDNKSYTVARLCMEGYDSTTGSCESSMLWMTQNLDLIVGPAGIGDLDSVNSDINYDLGATQGYSTLSNGVITWTPNSTMNTPATITNHAAGSPANSVTGWVEGGDQPAQAEGGDYYVYTSDNDGADTIYDSLSACEVDNHTKAECSHYHIGNYYNWGTTVAMNSSMDEATGINTDLTVAKNSICPKGWRLPNGLTGANGNETISEFNQLTLIYRIANGETKAHDTDAERWINVGWTTNGFSDFRKAPLYFARTGFIDGTTLASFGDSGLLWSSTARFKLRAYGLRFLSGALYPAAQEYRSLGLPIRCVAR